MGIAKYGWAAILLLAVLQNHVTAQPPWLTDPAGAIGQSPPAKTGPEVAGREDEQSKAPVATSQAPTSGSGGLLEPPPPLASQLPASVFDPVAESSGLNQEVGTVGPAWFAPWQWIPRDGWKNSIEFGVNGSAGNADSISYQAGARLKRKSDHTLFDLRITHNRTYADGVERQNNALTYLDWEKYFGDSRWSYYAKSGLEYDEFKAFNVRLNLNTGAGFRVYDEDDLSLVLRSGAGASREIGGPDNSWTPEFLLGVDYEHQVTKRHKLIARTDYFPSLDNFGDFRLVSDLAWEYLIDDDGNLSLKLGVNDRYDSTPHGLNPNDVNYTALLLIKF